jgi:hypothetical protein
MLVSGDHPRLWQDLRIGQLGHKWPVEPDRLLRIE